MTAGSDGLATVPNGEAHNHSEPCVLGLVRGWVPVLMLDIEMTSVVHEPEGSDVTVSSWGTPVPVRRDLWV